MKKWSLRILSAFLTFTLGICVVAAVRLSLAPAIKPPTVYTAANIQTQLPPTQIAEVAPPSDKVAEVMRPHLVSISPYEIKRLVDENHKAAERHQWEELPLETIWNQLDVHPPDSDSTIVKCNGDCRADVVTLELDGKPGAETMLILDSWDLCRFLIFKQNLTRRGLSAQWEFMGYIDASSWYVDPQYRVLTAGAKRWLVINENYGHGSGFGAYTDSWYEITENGMTNVLSYQSSLYSATWMNEKPGISRKTEVLKIEDSEGITTVVLKSYTSYEGFLEATTELSPLWSNKRTATFLKGRGMHEFVFDSPHSEMAQAELSADYGEAITDEEVLKYNYMELNKLAAGGNAKQKEWLRSYLAACDDTIERESLQSVLEGTQP